MIFKFLSVEFNALFYLSLDYHFKTLEMTFYPIR